MTTTIIIVAIIILLFIVAGVWYYYSSTPAPVVIKGWNFPENDLKDKDGKCMVITDTAQGCIDRCKGINGCNVAQWFSGDKNCWSKTMATGAAKNEAGETYLMPGYKLPEEDNDDYYASLE